MDYTATHLTRTAVLEVARDRWGSTGRWTTADLASLLGVSEPRVRGCVGWLVHHGLAVAAGRQWGTTRAGDRYAVACYRLSGGTERARSDPAGLVREQASVLAQRWV